VGDLDAANNAMRIPDTLSKAEQAAGWSKAAKRSWRYWHKKHLRKLAREFAELKQEIAYLTTLKRQIDRRRT
jgi:hypothetical protein